MKRAGSKVSTHAMLGSLVGAGFGIYCAFRLRSMRLAYFNAFRAVEKPVAVQFADGRTRTLILNSTCHFLTGTEPIPDISDKLSPSKWGDAATYFFFAVGGTFLGGELGFVTGTASASRTITKKPEVKERIEEAFRNYRIDAMKQEIKQLERKPKFEQLFRS